jgi:hypothetical protein
MAFIPLRRSERIKVEFYCAALLAIIAFGFSPPWWIEAVMALLLSVMIVHLILSARSLAELGRGGKGALVTGAVLVVLLLSWLHIKPAFRVQAPQLAADTRARTSGTLEQAKTAVGGAPSDQQLARDTATLVLELRDFQRKVDGWNLTASNDLKLEQKAEESAQDPRPAHIEHAKQLSATISKLNQEFNTQLKPRVVTIRKQLMDRIPRGSVTPKPTVDWALQYGFTTYPNAVGDIANELEDLASKLPQNG